MAEYPIDIGFYESSSLPLAAQNCINHYPNNPQTKGAISQGALFYTPGIEQVSTAGDGPARGYNVFNDELYVISGNGFYHVSRLWVSTYLGDVSGIDRVITSNNGVTICIQVPGGSGYFYSESSGFYEIVDPVYQDFQSQLGGVTSVTYKNGYFVFTTGFEFFLSSLSIVNGGRSFDALDVSTAELRPDKNVRAMTIKNELYILGSETIELFQDIGSADPTVFTFQRITGATIDKGLTARHSLIEFDNSFVFIGKGFGESIAVWKGTSGAAIKISTSAIDHALQQYTDDEISNIYAWTYTEDGNFFVGFTLPDTTFVYEATTSSLQQRQVWHERRSNNTQWRVNHIVDVYSNNYALDSIDGKIGLLNRSYTSEYSNEISREFTGAYLYNSGKRIFINYIEIKTESGVGKPANPDLPEVELSVSFDGGRNFNTLGNRSLGAYEDYTARQVWFRIGSAETSCIFRFNSTGTTVVNYTNLIIDVQGGI